MAEQKKAEPALADILKFQLNQAADKASEAAAAASDAKPSQNEMIAQAILGLAPILAGAALGGARGGAIGAEAGLAGLSKLEAAKKEERDRADKLRAQEKERLSSAILLSKELRGERTEAEKLAIEKARLEIERGKAKKEAKEDKGSKLTSEQTQILSGYDSGDKQLQEIEKRIDENSAIMGPIYGRVSGGLGYGTAAKAFDARMKLAAQDIGKSLEGGKLAEGDVPRYREMLPNITDTPEVAKEKIAILREQIATKRQAAINTFGAGGYNVSKLIDSGPISVNIPKTRQSMSLPSGLMTNDAIAAPPKPDFQSMSPEQLKSYLGIK